MSELDDRLATLREKWVKLCRKLTSTVEVKVEGCPLSIEKQTRKTGNPPNAAGYGNRIHYNGKPILDCSDVEKMEAVKHIPAIITAWKQSRRLVLASVMEAESSLSKALAQLEAEEGDEE